ncbi:hypothetical protein DZB80_21945 [Salmonella enterica]|nr:hypothetical protein [Salmonella enterica]ECU8792489.1 hypothetical protein [Salmonella enterica]
MSISPLFRWPNSVNHFNQAKAEGLGLTDWVQKHMDNVCDLAGQPDTTMYKDDGETSGQK